MDRAAVVADFRIAKAELDANRLRLAENRTQLRTTVAHLQLGSSREERLRESAIARLRARLETQPVIEQAKGVIMSRSGCDPDEAFDALRRASQRLNIKVSDLAIRIVATTRRTGPPLDAVESAKAG